MHPVSGSGITVSTPTTAGHSYQVAFSGGVPPVPNLAQLATASASSDIGSIDWWAGYANDGQTASMPSTLGWSSNSNLSNDHTEFYQLDLGSPMTFNQVYLWPRSDVPNVGQGFPTSYDVAVSYDGINWTVVTSGTAASPATAVVVVPFETQTARYVRINGLHLAANPNDAGQYRMQFAEVGIFNVAQASFSLKLAAPSLTLAPGKTSSVKLTAVPASGFNGTVTFSETGLPAGANYEFLSAGSANSDYFVVYVKPGTAAGTFPVTLRGTSGSATASIAFTLVIPPPAPSFTLALAASSLTLAPGAGGNVVVTAKPVSGFAGTITFSASGAPSGVSIAFLGTGVVNQDYLIAYVPLGTATGTFNITLTGTSGTTSASTTLKLVIP